MLSRELVAQGQHVMTVCNACRYCEAYCPVFQAMENRLTFTKNDLTYLATLCHNCGECLYACQYAPPHEFGINVPQTFSEIRIASYEEGAWPRFLSGAFERPRAATITALAVGALAIMLVARMFYGQTDVAGDFYQVVPHHVMVTLFSIAGLAVVGAMVAVTVRLKPDPTTVSISYVGSGFSRTIRGIRDALTLRHLHPAGVDCTASVESRHPWRRWFHHCTSYGFALCFASTSVAAVYHLFLGWRAPYPFTSLPVVLGTAGGIGLVIGPAGLLALQGLRDSALGSPAERDLNIPFLTLLFLTSLTGLLLLVLRDTASMPPLLIVHLAAVLALFLTLPFGKFIHAVYRVAALIKFAREDAR